MISNLMMGVLPSLKVLTHFGNLLGERHDDHVHLESFRRKGLSDGLGCVVKSIVSAAVCAEKLFIRVNKELYDFLIDRYTLHVSMF